MKAVLLALVLCLGALAFAPAAEAHTVVCRSDDVRCILACERHALEDPRGDHDCAIVGFP